MEPNPFEKSFATKDGEEGKEGAGVKQESQNSLSSRNSNKHNLKIPNFPTIGSDTGKNVGSSMSIFTPGGRKLPPLALSPGGSHVPTGLGTPGTTNMWNSLLNATGTTPGHPGHGSVGFGNFNNNKKSGLTPNESNIRTGFTPGGMNNQSAAGFPFSNHILGLSPGILNSPVTPGFSNLFGLSQLSVNGGVASNGPLQHLHPSSNSVSNNELNSQNSERASGALLNNNAKTDSQVMPPIEPKKSDSNSSKTSDYPSTEESALTSTNSSESQLQVDVGTKRKAEDTNSKTKIQKLGEEVVKDEPKSTVCVDQSPNGPKENNKGSKKNKKLPRELTDDEKRKNFLERNRVAASKCRQRKKQLVRKMEDELTFYSSGYRELSSQVTQLREQLVNLKGIIMSHKDCPMLLSSVGGYYQLNNIIQQIDYVGQLSARTQHNASSMPSTIPTTLNNAGNEIVNSSMSPNPYMISGNSHKGSTEQEVPLGVNQAGGRNHAAGQGTADLVPPGNRSLDFVVPSQDQGINAAPNMHALSTVPTTTPQAANQQPVNDMRTIQSATNLSSMAQNDPKLQDFNSSFNLRAVNSMINLSLYNIPESQRPSGNPPAQNISASPNQNFSAADQSAYATTI